MKKLIEALHVIQDECRKHIDCSDCPFYLKKSNGCGIHDTDPCNWEINDEVPCRGSGYGRNTEKEEL